LRAQSSFAAAQQRGCKEVQTLEFDSAQVCSSLPGVAWPAVPAGPAAAILSLLWQYERSQWLEPAELERLQFGQVEVLLAHCWEAVPFYRERLEAAGYKPGRALTRELWRRIPTLTRAELQEHGARLRSPHLPREHQPAQEIRSSGSTGRAVTALTTAVTRTIWGAMKMREHAWHRRELTARHAAIRPLESAAGRSPSGVAQKGWGRTEAALFAPGPSFGLDIGATLAEQAAWLRRVDPHYLLAFPSALQALLLRSRDEGFRPRSLREVRTISEPLEPEVRELCRREWGVPVTDVYSARETGYLALQCPGHEHYHVQSESALVEVLDDRGAPCAPGELGRVAVTPLFNFGLPLVRYELGDLAVPGEPCPCGRGLPVLGQIKGRVRNMVQRPSGERFWPQFSALSYSAVLPVRQHQIAQVALDRLELRLVADRRGTPQEEAKLRAIIVEKIGYPFEIAIAYTDHIPRNAGGKYEEFKSEIE
jgi:phenylacetate-CoA ligase